MLQFFLLTTVGGGGPIKQNNILALPYFRLATALLTTRALLICHKMLSQNFQISTKIMLLKFTN